MRPQIQAVVVPSETTEFNEDLRRMFRELDHSGGGVLSGECSPPVDVYETDGTLEITVDLPGIDPAFVRVIAKGDAIVIAGEKAPRRARGDSTFHLVERGYGRFARAVRLTTACDPGRAQATVVNGELRISLPKQIERRGRTIHIPVTPRGMQ
jgi:HSP20 family protein